MDTDRKINSYTNRPKMTEKHHTRMLVDDRRNINHSSGKMEIGRETYKEASTKETELSCSLVSMTGLATGDKKHVFQMCTIAAASATQFSCNELIAPLKKCSVLRPLNQLSLITKEACFGIFSFLYVERQERV